MYYPRWKTWLILAVCALGIVLAAPNLMRDKTAQLPSWLQPVNLGLDLQGGSHLLMEVDIASVMTEQLTGLVEKARSDLRDAKIRYVDLGLDGQAVTLKVLDTSAHDQALALLKKMEPQDTTAEMAADGRATVRYTEAAVQTRKKQVVDQSIEIVRRRVDELGTREPTIVRQGDDRIVVQVPGLTDPQRLKDLLGKTAKMTFHLVDESVSPDDIQRGRVPPGSMKLASADAKDAAYYVVRRKVEVSGDALTDAQPSFQTNEPVVSFRFNTAGGKRFGDITSHNVGKRFAIVLDEKVISAPVIREPILGGSGIISGSFTVQSANDLALLLRAGALPAPLTILEERTVGPDLGADSIRAGAIACAVGLVLVIATMIVMYGLFGVFANIALLVNLGLLMGVLSALGATLTLPGIAGIVLTMGMAVDSNVLIFERMREESNLGRSTINAMTAGFDRAFTTILDSQLTTLIAGILLFQFGTGPVRGFAVTLTVGLATSMFTAIWVTRLMLQAWARSRKPTTLPI